MLVDIYNWCCEEEYFPREWKRAGLVLIPKEVPLNLASPKVRPICLLDELGKVLETILVQRIKEWIGGHLESGWSEDQYGFSDGKSTVDALMTVHETIVEANSQGRVVIAVSLDIKNAFNSLPWESIRRALARKGFPSNQRTDRQLPV